MSNRHVCPVECTGSIKKESEKLKTQSEDFVMFQA